MYFTTYISLLGHVLRKCDISKYVCNFIRSVLAAMSNFKICLQLY